MTLDLNMVFQQHSCVFSSWCFAGVTAPRASTLHDEVLHIFLAPSALRGFLSQTLPQDENKLAIRTHAKDGFGSRDILRIFKVEHVAISHRSVWNGAPLRKGAVSSLVLASARVTGWHCASPPAVPYLLSRTLFTPLKSHLFTPLFALFLASLPPTSQRKEAARITAFSCPGECIQEGSLCRGPLPLAADAGALLLPGLRLPPGGIKRCGWTVVTARVPPFRGLPRGRFLLVSSLPVAECLWGLCASTPQGPWWLSNLLCPGHATHNTCPPRVCPKPGCAKLPSFR